MKSYFEKVKASVAWLQENYSHIWDNEALTVEERCGFLAACCDSRRCFLATLGLKDRIDAIRMVGFNLGRTNAVFVLMEENQSYPILGIFSSAEKLMAAAVDVVAGKPVQLAMYEERLNEEGATFEPVFTKLR